MEHGSTAPSRPQSAAALLDELNSLEKKARDLQALSTRVVYSHFGPRPSGDSSDKEAGDIPTGFLPQAFASCRTLRVLLDQIQDNVVELNGSHGEKGGELRRVRPSEG